MYLRGLAPDGSLPSHTCHQVCWCALTTPFHPHTVSDAICSLLHYAVGSHRLTVSQHHYPMECGLSSAGSLPYRDFLAYPQLYYTCIRHPITIQITNSIIVFTLQRMCDLHKIVYIFVDSFSKHSTKVLSPLEFGGRCRVSDGGGCFNQSSHRNNFRLK